MNNQTKEKLLILERIENGTASESDLLWYSQWCASQQVYDNAEISLEEERKEDMYRWIASRTFNKPFYVRKKVQIFVSFIFFSLLAALMAVFFHQIPLSDQGTKDVINAKRTTFGKEKGVVLALENGDEINLEKQSTGIIGEGHNNSVIKNSDSSLVYRSLGKYTEPIFNTLYVARGNQYQLTLSDGTKVWLNASTSLRFPVDFNGLGERKVYLEGEAYFEVAKNPKVPFIVITDNQEIKVLGTHFNIKADKGRPSSETTLLEGSVLVNNTVKLIPGEQLSITGGTVKIVKVNVLDFIAWKNGYFNFEGEQIGEIMEEISRWYDVEIHYDGSIPKDKFDATISRKKSLDDVLELLELTGMVKFKRIANRIDISQVKTRIH